MKAEVKNTKKLHVKTGDSVKVVLDLMGSGSHRSTLQEDGERRSAASKLRLEGPWPF